MLSQYESKWSFNTNSDIDRSRSGAEYPGEARKNSCPAD